MTITQVTAVINGQTYTLTYNETARKYEAVITPTATSHHQESGYYNASVTATNDSGVTASTDGANIPGLRLVALETTAPTITRPASPPPMWWTRCPRSSTWTGTGRSWTMRPSPSLGPRGT